MDCPDNQWVCSGAPHWNVGPFGENGPACPRQHLTGLASFGAPGIRGASSGWECSTRRPRIRGRTVMPCKRLSVAQNLNGLALGFFNVLEFYALAWSFIDPINTA